VFFLSLSVVGLKCHFHIYPSSCQTAKVIVIIILLYCRAQSVSRLYQHYQMLVNNNKNETFYIKILPLSLDLFNKIIFLILYDLSSNKKYC